MGSHIKLISISAAIVMVISVIVLTALNSPIAVYY